MGLINMFKPLPTFLSPVQLINLSNIDNFFLWIFFGNAGNWTQGDKYFWNQRQGFANLAQPKKTLNKTKASEQDHNLNYNLKPGLFFPTLL